ncbi:hypothetical protein FA10DRAFT_186486, partial [Acaromyces ingoldii]
MPYHPMKDSMSKLDEWGAAQKKKYQTSTNAGPKASVGDRLKLARGIDDRWEKTSKSKQQDDGADEGEDPHNIVPRRIQAPAAASRFAGPSKGPPPPPPQRSGTSSHSMATPATVPAVRGPPPTLPRRMDNENGTSNPPPSYGQITRPPAPPPRSATQSEGPGYIEFSKFTQADKEAFFELLDEFFESK